MSVALHSPALVEADWLERCRAGDLAAWRWLYDRQFERVYRVVLRLGVPERDAADVCQEVFLRVYRGLDRFRGDAQVGTWLFRIALNEARRSQRLGALRRAFLGRLGREPQPSAPVPDAAAERGERWRELAAVLDRMKPKLREVFVLFEVEELTVEEVAAVVGSGIETVKSRIKRARAEFERLSRQRAVLALAGGRR